jgi:hypothetical protein
MASMNFNVYIKYNLKLKILLLLHRIFRFKFLKDKLSSKEFIKRNVIITNERGVKI